MRWQSNKRSYHFSVSKQRICTCSRAAAGMILGHSQFSVFQRSITTLRSSAKIGLSGAQVKSSSVLVFRFFDSKLQIPKETSFRIFCSFFKNFVKFSNLCKTCCTCFRAHIKKSNISCNGFELCRYQVAIAWGLLAAHFPHACWTKAVTIKNRNHKKVLKCFY